MENPIIQQNKNVIIVPNKFEGQLSYFVLLIARSIGRSKNGNPTIHGFEIVFQPFTMPHSSHSRGKRNAIFCSVECMLYNNTENHYSLTYQQCNPNKKWKLEIPHYFHTDVCILCLFSLRFWERRLYQRETLAFLPFVFVISQEEVTQIIKINWRYFCLD